MARTIEGTVRVSPHDSAVRLDDGCQTRVPPCVRGWLHTWVSYIPFSGVGLFRREKATLSTDGSPALDKTKPSVPWRAVNSHIVKKLVFRSAGAGRAKGRL